MISRRQLLFFILATASLPVWCQSQSKKQTVITLADLETMFGNIRAKTKWNVDGNMLWGYFFFDPQSERLNVLAGALTNSGYRFVNLYPTDDKASYVLHVEKIEAHTPKTLLRRNQELELLAEKYGVERYDGMDVGPVGVKQ